MTEPASTFLEACACRPGAHVPVWFMRQAGRSLPEYRALRGQGSILDAIRDPELACELTLQPVRRYGVDAAILFSDITVPLVATGVELEIVAGTGPVIASPIRRASDVARLRPLEPELDSPYVADAITAITKECATPLIGFAGAPFTLASYLIEGGPSRSFVRTKALMHEDPTTWFALMDHLAALALCSLDSQIDAGVRAVQLFDSWAGALSRADYERYVLPHSRAVLESVADVPRIHFGVDTGELLALMASAGADVVGVDWRVPLERAAARAPGRCLQGNLDPVLCLVGGAALRAAADEVLRQGASLPGHVFNLGHGVLPETDPGVLAELVVQVHEFDPER